MSGIPALLAGFIWIWIATCASMVPAVAFEMEGFIDVSATIPTPPEENSVRVLNDFTRGELPARWNCHADSGVERIRNVSLCPVMGDAPALSAGRARVIRYRVLVERGLEAEADKFVDDVSQILNAPTGWAQSGLSFTRVHAGHDLTIVLATPQSVDQLCQPLQTRSWLSCAIAGRAMINAKRWREGTKTWRTDIAGYHHYLINHEVGHLLGMSHATCPAQGQPAPIMLPQTRFLGGCTANGTATARDLAMLRRVIPRFTRLAMRRRAAHAKIAARTERAEARRFANRAIATQQTVATAAPTPKRVARAPLHLRVPMAVPLPVRHVATPLALPRRVVRQTNAAPPKPKLLQVAQKAPRWRNKAWRLGRLSKRKAGTKKRKLSRRPTKLRIRRKYRPKTSIQRRIAKRAQPQQQAGAKRWRLKWFKGPQ